MRKLTTIPFHSRQIPNYFQIEIMLKKKGLLASNTPKNIKHRYILRRIKAV